MKFPIALLVTLSCAAFCTANPFSTPRQMFDTFAKSIQDKIDLKTATFANRVKELALPSNSANIRVPRDAELVFALTALTESYNPALPLKKAQSERFSLGTLAARISSARKQFDVYKAYKHKVDPVLVAELFGAILDWEGAK
jgi:hypothetical protein